METAGVNQVTLRKYRAKRVECSMQSPEANQHLIVREEECAKENQRQQPERDRNKAKICFISVRIYFKFSITLVTHKDDKQSTKSHQNTPPHNIMKYPSYLIMLLPIHIKNIICRRNSSMHTHSKFGRYYIRMLAEIVSTNGSMDTFSYFHFTFINFEFFYNRIKLSKFILIIFFVRQVVFYYLNQGS